MSTELDSEVSLTSAAIFSPSGGDVFKSMVAVGDDENSGTKKIQDE